MRHGQEQEIEKLLRIVSEAQAEQGRQEKELAAVLSERDVLRTQLTRREEELTAVYDKLKL